MFIYTKHGDKHLSLPIPEDFTPEDVQFLIKGIKGEKHLQVKEPGATKEPDAEPVKVKEPASLPHGNDSRLPQGAIIQVETKKVRKVKERAPEKDITTPAESTPAEPCKVESVKVKISGPQSKNCQVCGQVFSWEQKGRGRPATKCEGCRPKKPA